MRHQIILNTNRISYHGDDRLDITIKSAGPEGKLLAPDRWDMVMGVKAGRIPWGQYQEWYLGILARRYAADPKAFTTILQRDSVTLCCYCSCKDDRQCHRFMAVEFLRYVARLQGFVVTLGELH